MLRPTRGTPGMPPMMRSITRTEPQLSRDWTGPKTAPGRTVTSEVSLSRMNSHAACSASSLERRYSSIPTPDGSVHTVSSNDPVEPSGGVAAAQDDVITTRSTPASTANRSTRNVPSRAGPTRSALPDMGDATCSTYRTSFIASAQPASDVRSACTTS